MKILKDNKVIEDLKLRKGEVFQVGTGKKSFKVKYDGTDGINGKWHHLKLIN